MSVDEYPEPRAKPGRMESPSYKPETKTERVCVRVWVLGQKIPWRFPFSDETRIRQVIQFSLCRSFEKRASGGFAILSLSQIMDEMNGQWDWD